MDTEHANEQGQTLSRLIWTDEDLLDVAIYSAARGVVATRSNPGALLVRLLQGK
jgi:hypothetical protein